MDKIELEMHRDFGNGPTCFAVDDAAQFICDLLKRKSLTEKQVKKIKDFGIEVKINKEQVTL